MKRTELREQIFKLVFGIEFCDKEEIAGQQKLYFEQLEEIQGKDLEYIQGKAQKIAERAAEIDALLNEHTTGWKTARMNKADLAILRLAVYEIKWDEDVPAGVAINEAVELAKKFSSDEGPAFINAVLAKFV
ncbi:transcription antitermination factor NusB [Dorea sp. 5-2]|nr:transcription antitermination factor NusB [Dorea sp. 5-2]